MLVYNNVDRPAAADVSRRSRRRPPTSGADTLADVPPRHASRRSGSALLAGGLLAFALSFDEVIVTLFTAGGVKTLPIWIFESFRLAHQVSLVNVAGMVAILLSVIPVLVASRLTSDAGGVTGAKG